MERIVVSQNGAKHITRDFEKGSVSHRRILPHPDGTRVKVTQFEPKQGFGMARVVNLTDETVYVVSGQVSVQDLRDGNFIVANAGALYCIPAGVPFKITALADSVLICMFSAVPGGPLPDSE